MKLVGKWHGTLYNTTGSYKTHFSLFKVWRIREVKFPDKLPLITSGHYTRAVSVLISLDENGEIANWTTCTEGGFMGPSEKNCKAGIREEQTV